MDSGLIRLDEIEARLRELSACVDRAGDEDSPRKGTTVLAVGMRDADSILGEVGIGSRSNLGIDVLAGQFAVVLLENWGGSPRDKVVQRRIPTAK